MVNSELVKTYRLFCDKLLFCGVAQQHLSAVHNNSAGKEI